MKITYLIAHDPALKRRAEAFEKYPLRHRPMKRWNGCREGVLSMRMAKQRHIHRMKSREAGFNIHAAVPPRILQTMHDADKLLQVNPVFASRARLARDEAKKEKK